MSDPSLRPLQLVDANEDGRRFGAVVETIAGIPMMVSIPLPDFGVVAEISRLAGLLERLGERMEVLEAELVPAHRSRKCPCCHRLSLAVVETRPHPEFATEGIEQHEVRCSSGYQASRLYDPRDFLR